MSGTVWPSLVAGAKAKASEVESKFDWMEGDFIPFASGVKTDQSYDLGSSSFKWVDIWGTGRVYSGAGSVANCAFARWDNINTGIYFPATNAVGFVTQGSEAMRIDSVGDVGIGTNAPGTALHVVDSGQDVLRVSDASSYTLDIGTTVADTAMITVYGSAKLDLGTAGTGRVKIDEAGHVTQPTQSSFLAYNSAQDANVTGDGTVVSPVDFDTEVYDQNADFSADTFTAPVTGRYYLSATVAPVAGAGTWQMFLKIVTSNRNYSNSNHLINFTTDQLNVVVIADMDAFDTATVSYKVTGGAKTVSINGGSTQFTDAMATYYSGSLIN